MREPKDNGEINKKYDIESKRTKTKTLMTLRIHIEKNDTELNKGMISRLLEDNTQLRNYM